MAANLAEMLPPVIFGLARRYNRSNTNMFLFRIPPHEQSPVFCIHISFFHSFKEITGESVCLPEDTEKNEESVYSFLATCSFNTQLADLVEANKSRHPGLVEGVVIADLQCT